MHIDSLAGQCKDQKILKKQRRLTVKIQFFNFVSLI